MSVEYPLSCYSRLLHKYPGGAQEWDACGSDVGGSPKISLRLSQLGFLHISCGTRELETLNISSNFASVDVRAVFRDRHMLFLQRLSGVGGGEGGFRRFRVKFHSRRHAADCAQELASRNVVVKGGDGVTVARAERSSDFIVGSNTTTKSGDVAVKDLAFSMFQGGGDGNSALQLPSLYKSAVELNAEAEEAVRSCLLDPQFHRFVASVQQLLQQMTSTPE